jgi:hypothetical protein
MKTEPYDPGAGCWIVPLLSLSVLLIGLAIAFVYRLWN